jgi:hypothetical protein
VNSLVILGSAHELMGDLLNVVEMKFAPSVGFGGLEVLLGELEVIHVLSFKISVNLLLTWEIVLGNDFLSSLFILTNKPFPGSLGSPYVILKVCSNVFHVFNHSLLSRLVNLVQRSNSVFRFTCFGKLSCQKLNSFEVT